MNNIFKDLIQEKLKSVYKKQDIKFLGLFGSFARGEATSASDVDLLVDFNSSKTLFDLAEVKIFFQDMLGKKVDLVMRDSIKNIVKPYIEKDLITLYEQNR